MITLEQIKQQNNLLRTQIKSKEKLRALNKERRKLLRENFGLIIQNKSYPVFLLGREVKNTFKLMFSLSIIVIASVFSFFIGLANGVK